MIVFAADPPWRFSDRLPGSGRGAVKHYACMDVEAIIACMRDRIGQPKHAVLFLWRVAAMQVEAHRVVDGCGFRVKSELVWAKQTKTGKPHFGMGHYVRASHETCLICVRGSALPATRSQRSVFYAPVGVHSEKPSAFYRIVSEMYPRARKVEMFARVVRRGWEQHGAELGKLKRSA